MRSEKSAPKRISVIKQTRMAVVMMLVVMLGAVAVAVAQRADVQTTTSSHMTIRCANLTGRYIHHNGPSARMDTTGRTSAWSST